MGPRFLLSVHVHLLVSSRHRTDLGGSSEAVLGESLARTCQPTGGTWRVRFSTADGSDMWGSGPQVLDSGKQCCAQLSCQALSAPDTCGRWAVGVLS